jgi:tryptophan-rich sensory protein
MNGMREAALYTQWIQPSWAPASWLFGPVWSVLYVFIAISFGFVFYKVFKKEIPKLVAVPFVINLLANAAFTPVQFGLQNLPLAAFVILVVLVTIPWMMWAVYPHAKWVAYVQIPYLLWVSFATVLQLTITSLNW